MTNIRNQAKFLVGLALALVGMMSLGVPLGHTSNLLAPLNHLAGNPSLTNSTTNSPPMPCPPEIFAMTATQFGAGAVVNIPSSVQTTCGLPPAVFFPVGTSMVPCDACVPGGVLKVTVFNVWLQKDATPRTSAKFLKFSCVSCPPPPSPPCPPQPYSYTDCGTGVFKTGAQTVTGMGFAGMSGSFATSFQCSIYDGTGGRIISGKALSSTGISGAYGFAYIKLTPISSPFNFLDRNLSDSKGICPITFPSFP